MRKRLLILFLLATSLGAGIYYINRSGPQDDPNQLRVSGNIEVTEVRMSFRIPGQLAFRAVDEGETVQAGQVLARLHDRDQHLVVSRAQANLLLARAVLAELEAGSRPQEIEIARAELERAEAEARSVAIQLRQAEADYHRYAALVENGGVSRTMYEEYKARYETSVNTWQGAQARIKSAEELLDLRLTGPRQEQIDQARAQVTAAETALNQANQQVFYTELISPLNAVVLSTSAEIGEYLNSSSPVVTIGDLERPWLRAYINEPHLGKVKLNQQVRVTTDSYPDKIYSGRISFISSQVEFTPKSVQTFEERVKLMYRIKIALDNPDAELKPGMPADGLIDLIDR